MAWIRRKTHPADLPGEAEPASSPSTSGPSQPLQRVNGSSVATLDEHQDHSPTHDVPLAEYASPDEDEPAWFSALKREIHQEVIATMDLTSLGQFSEAELRHEIRRMAVDFCSRRSQITAQDRERLVNEVLDEAFGLGPLEPLLADKSISDILINGAKTVYIERRGQLLRTNVVFHDDRHLIQIVQRIAAQTGRRVDETCPMLDSRLADGSRLNAIIPPLALDGPLVSIRRFGAQPIGSDDLLAFESMTPDMLNFLSACVRAKVNILISGGTGSGKTTLLNCLSNFIPGEERVATIEDAAELKLQQPHVVRMETRPPNVEGEGRVTTRDLTRNALRMRPDRIIIGECRGEEALDMLQAMNTGHEGSMTTIHANTTRDALSRLEMMVGMAGFDLPIWVIRKQVASAIHVVIQASRLMGGRRKITKISEITGMEGDVLSMHDIFEFQQTGLDEQRMAVGEFHATGIRPHLLKHLEAYGAPLPVTMFERRTLSPAGAE